MMTHEIIMVVLASVLIGLIGLLVYLAMSMRSWVYEEIYKFIDELTNQPPIVVLVFELGFVCPGQDMGGSHQWADGCLVWQHGFC